MTTRNARAPRVSRASAGRARSLTELSRAGLGLRDGASQVAWQQMLRILLLVVAMLCATAAQGQEAPHSAPGAPEEQRQLYDTLIDRCFDEFARENWPAARTLMLRAHAIHATARTWRGLGITAFNMHDYARALSELERALSCPARPLDATLRNQVTGLLERASHFVARYQLTLVPADARLSVDDHPVLVDEAGRALLDLGEHVLVLEAPGHTRHEQRLRVREPGVHALTLRATPGSASRVARRLRSYAWLTSAVSVAAFGGALAAWKVSDNRYDSLREHCREQLGCLESEISTGQIQRLDRANVALLSVGGVLAAGAAALWIFGGRTSE